MFIYFLLACFTLCNLLIFAMVTACVCFVLREFVICLFRKFFFLCKLFARICIFNLSGLIFITVVAVNSNLAKYSVLPLTIWPGDGVSRSKVRRLHPQLPGCKDPENAYYRQDQLSGRLVTSPPSVERRRHLDFWPRVTKNPPLDESCLCLACNEHANNHDWWRETHSRVRLIAPILRNAFVRRLYDCEEGKGGMASCWQG